MASVVPFLVRGWIVGWPRGYSYLTQSLTNTGADFSHFLSIHCIRNLGCGKYKFKSIY